MVGIDEDGGLEVDVEAPHVPGCTLWRTDKFVAWNADGKSVYVFEEKRVPQPLTRVDIATGVRAPGPTVVSEDRVGVLRMDLGLQPLRDGADYAFSYYKQLSGLFVLEPPE